MKTSTQESTLWKSWTPVTSNEKPMCIVRSQGNRIQDSEGTWYIDGLSGVLNASCGHNHPRLVDAAARQMRSLAHYDLMVASHDPSETLATRLAELLPGELNETSLLNSGSEAIEAGMKIALQYWRNIGEPRDRVITFTAGYHGSTALAQHLSGLPFTASEWTRPFPIDHVDMPMPPRELRSAEGSAALVERFAAALENGPPAAAVIVEPLLGLGGCVVLPQGFLSELRKLCDQHGTLLFLDEIFTGFGRTGRFFGFDHDEVTPDIVAMSKGISGGYLPLAAVTVTSAIKESFAQEPIAQGLRYGHTTGGHAVASSVANTVLDVIADEKLVENAAAQGSRLLDGLKHTLDPNPRVTDVRGLGLVVAIEAESPDWAQALANAVRDQGVMVKHERGVIRIAPPLTLETAETTEIVDAVRTGAGLLP